MRTFGFKLKKTSNSQTNSYLVSGYEFHKLATYSFCNRYNINLQPSNIKETDIIFLNLDLFNNFIKLMNNHNIKTRCTIITHNSDLMFTDRHALELEQFAHTIYAINTSCSNKIVKTIPIGFSDDNNISHSHFINDLNNKPRDILAYMNFKISNNSSIRTECFNTFKTYSWVFKEFSVSNEDFYNKLRISKYVICPEGTGIDCHRIYESLYFNAIPLLKTSKMDEFYKKLPVIIFEKWDDITENFLVETYSKFKDKLDLWKDRNKEWYKSKYWLGINA